MANRTPEYLSLSWLTGPIFDKELRVTSRRKRYYFLRCGYVLLMTAFITYLWLIEVRFPSSNSFVYQSSRMAIVGIVIVTYITWFQFIAAQSLAAIFLSTAISEEIQKNTLAVLMATPVTSLQIVTGKILSRLFQVILLLLISLPLSDSQY